MTRGGKGKTARVVQTPNAKLTEDDVRLMRALRAGGASVPSLSATFEVSERQVTKICMGHAWSHVR